jgi:hypothetical protein
MVDNNVTLGYWGVRGRAPTLAYSSLIRSIPVVNNGLMATKTILVFRFLTYHI